MSKRRIKQGVALLVTVATLSPILAFVSNITDPYLRSLFLIGNEQSFDLCSVQEECEKPNRRFRNFLRDRMNERVSLDITYTSWSASWDPCTTSVDLIDPQVRICESWEDHLPLQECANLNETDLIVRSFPQGLLEDLERHWEDMNTEPEFFDLPTFGSEQCTYGAPVRFPMDAVIRTSSGGTGHTVYRIFGDYLVGGRYEQLFFLHPLE